MDTGSRDQTDAESRDQMQARHRRELKDLQARITSKKKNATKKTRKSVSDECADMERRLREAQAAQAAALDRPPRQQGEPDADAAPPAEPSSLKRLEDKVEETLERAAGKLGLAPAPEQSQPQPQQQQAGKKRNRQRERLARRAAEQEAAAQRAEEEAAGMTDHRARESEYMRKMFATYRLVERDVEPDGHCLFSAVADQLAHSGVPVGEAGEPPYRAVRRAAAAFMRDHAGDFAPFLEGDLEAYAARIRDTAEWGGQLELAALARVYGAEIRVIQDGRMERIGEEEGRATGRMMWLAYYRHGYGLGEHYNSLRKKS
ncbi:uncharacterized protein UV8b_07515 [Ustilaginoidea virens]|uniref:OTU domain-containing protein n=1 Tax=Ustilaginoidea virens TaxID=1159556 RepID=A0A1B5KTT8_USTVR|nr:uncharacterized protein UV8b_07515 [Ustilaginoidea virens]QUC23274.1 hypothetical protein UV8b_07515 [Ustilaginoidea virens]GAO14347.1 hypothetical protein UVI_02034220 [Ustilaginoidea virens]